MEALWESGAVVQAYDPAAMEEAARIYGDKKELKLCASADAALEGADALVVVTEWRHFASPDFEEIKKTLKNQLFLTGAICMIRIILKKWVLIITPSDAVKILYIIIYI